MKTTTYKVSDCFRGKNIVWRDADLDTWLSPRLPELTGKISHRDLEHDMTFKEIAEEFLGGSDVETIRKHAISLTKIEKMLKRPEENGLFTNECANLFFVVDGEKVFGLFAYWRGGWPRRGWDAYVRSFDYGYGWRASHRFFSRNSEPRNLGTLDAHRSDTLNLVLGQLTAVEKVLQDIEKKLV